VGRSFPLTVVRVHDARLVPEAFDERSLSPLVVRLEARSRREDGTRVEETRRYRAYAFEPGETVVPAPELRARPRAGGAERSVRGEPLRLRVEATLDPAAPGPPELPGEPLSRPFPWAAALAGLGLSLLAGSAALLASRRRRARAAPPAAAAPVAPPPPPDASTRALGRLAAIAARGGPPADAVAATALVVREYAADRFGVPALRRTSAELASSLRSRVAADARAALAQALATADAAKFAAHVPSAAERDEALGRATAFVRGSGP
jgi:hypothetical protein